MLKEWKPDDVEIEDVAVLEEREEMVLEDL